MSRTVRLAPAARKYFSATEIYDFVSSYFSNPNQEDGLGPAFLRHFSIELVIDELKVPGPNFALALSQMALTDNAKALKIIYQHFQEPPKESILAAATLYEGKIYSVPQPARHDKVLHKVIEETGVAYVRGEKQGFITNTGRFVDREEAVEIALKADQTPRNKWFELYSEDVW